MQQVDNFQPMSLIAVLRNSMKEVGENATLSDDKREGIIMGLAWAVAEITAQATAKDRFVNREFCGLCGELKPFQRSCDCFDNHCQ